MNPFIEKPKHRHRRIEIGRFSISAMAVAITALLLVACGGAVGVSGALNGNELIQHEVNVDNNALGRIEKNEPIPVLNDSSDAHNQRQFVIQESDPNKIEYLEIMGLDGTPIAHFTIKGQVSAMDTSETNPSQNTCSYGGNDGEFACGTVGLAEPNGIYGGADAGHFAFTTSGALIEWQGDFITSDQPFNIKTPEKLVLNESASITKTDLSHVIGNR